MLKRIRVMFLACAILLALVFPAFAEPGEGFTVEIPVAAVLERLENQRAAVLVDLDGGYSIEMTGIGEGSDFWLRAVIAKDTYFYAAMVLGSGEADTLEIASETREGGSAVAFMLDGDLAASAVLPFALTEPALTQFAQAQGAALRIEALPEAIEAAEETEPAEVNYGPLESRTSPWIIVGILLIAFALLTFAALAYWHKRSLLRMLRQARRRAGPLLAPIGKQAKKIKLPKVNLKLKKPAQVLVGDGGEAEPLPKMEEALLSLPPPEEKEPVLAGVKIMPGGKAGALQRQITMQRHGDEGGQQLPRGEEAMMNAYFLGKAPHATLDFSFITVGLRNREALSQAGGEASPPLFAPNPRGQAYSLEEDSGSLYLNVEYFAPPSFVMQSVLRGACAGHVFDLVDADGKAVALEHVTGHAILGIAPARTQRGKNGYALTQKGTLVIGDN